MNRNMPRGLNVLLHLPKIENVFAHYRIQRNMFVNMIPETVNIICEMFIIIFYYYLD